MIVVLLVVRVVGVSANRVESYVFSWEDFWVYGGKETQIIFVWYKCTCTKNNCINNTYTISTCNRKTLTVFLLTSFGQSLKCPYIWFSFVVPIVSIESAGIATFCWAPILWSQAIENDFPFQGGDVQTIGLHFRWILIYIYIIYWYICFCEVSYIYIHIRLSTHDLIYIRCIIITSIFLLAYSIINHSIHIYTHLLRLSSSPTFSLSPERKNNFSSLQM